MSADANKNKASFKCRRCRQFLFDDSSVLPSMPVDNDATDSLISNHGNIATTSSPRQCSVSSALWYIRDDSTPPWIQSVIDETQWTRGKLACPKCRGRLGSFDFLTPSIRHDRDRQQKQWSCIQINGSRVDRETPDSVLSKLRRRSPTSGLHIASPSASLTQDVGLRGSGGGETGSLPEGCWYLNTNELDTDQLPKNCGATKCDVKSKQNGKHFVEKDDHGSLGSSNETSHIGDASNSSKTAFQTLSHEANEFQDRPLEDNHTMLADTKSTTIDPENSSSLETDSIDETIQFGFTSNKSRETHCTMQTGCETLTKASENVASHPETKAQKVSSLPILNKEHPARQIQNSQDNQSNIHNSDVVSDSVKPHGFKMDRNAKSCSSPEEWQDFLEEHSSRQMLNTQDETSDFHISDVDNGSDKALEVPEMNRPADGHSSPEEWQDFLDELLSELEAEKNGIASSASRQCSVSQLDEEMEINSQSASENTEVRVSASENPDTSQSMSAYLQRAVLRVQKRERNKRKSERRKLRKQEKWMERRETEKRELMVEEQNLDATPQDILTILDSHNQTSATLREALTCPVCLDLFLNPHSCRPCGHLFCESCLRHLANSTQVSGGTPPCPLCRTVVMNAQPHEMLESQLR